MSNGSNDIVSEIADETPCGISDQPLGWSSSFFDVYDCEDSSEPGFESQDESKSKEPLIERLRIVFWEIHQPYVARALLVGLVCMAGFFLVKSYQVNGLVDIDQAAPVEAKFQIDINTAEIGEIVVLPGVGRRLASAIIEHRENVGRFEAHVDLCDVPGIGDKKLDSIKPFLLPID